MVKIFLFLFFFDGPAFIFPIQEPLAMAHSVQKVVVRCEDAEENGGKLGKNFLKCYFYIGMYRQDCQCCGFSIHAALVNTMCSGSTTSAN